VSRGKDEDPSISVLAGTNGAGKSSVAGEALRRTGSDYFNPDEATRRFMLANPGLDLRAANAEAWHEGKRRLEEAIASRSNFTFETTLGGNTIPALLEQASDSGLAVRIWYVGLDGPGLHIQRVRSRVAAGGHDIPEAKIRERFERSRENLARLLPKLTELVLYDNSIAGDPAQGIAPKPVLLLHVLDGRIVEACRLTEVPGWAKPIFAAAVRHYMA
jgi:predicted ABC-type ATPase